MNGKRQVRWSYTISWPGNVLSWSSRLTWAKLESILNPCSSIKCVSNITSCFISFLVVELCWRMTQVFGWVEADLLCLLPWLQQAVYTRILFGNPGCWCWEICRNGILNVEYPGWSKVLVHISDEENMHLSAHLTHYKSGTRPHNPYNGGAHVSVWQWQATPTQIQS